MIQGPDPGEYRGLSLEDQRRQNEMYRDLNEWNANALRIIESGKNIQRTLGIIQNYYSLRF